jgi:hypothetical protein
MNPFGMAEVTAVSGWVPVCATEEVQVWRDSTGGTYAVADHGALPWDASCGITSSWGVVMQWIGDEVEFN